MMLKTKLIAPAIISILLFTSASLDSESNWLANYDEAKKTATSQDRLILLNFSGSDWCMPCMRLEKSIFASSEFKSFAEANLVLLNADFPRRKKNRLSESQTAHNEQLAKSFNPQGSFPRTLVLNADGKIIGQVMNKTDQPADFIKQINQFISTTK